MRKEMIEGSTTETQTQMYVTDRGRENDGGGVENNKVGGKRETSVLSFKLNKCFDLKISHFTVFSEQFPSDMAGNK